MVDKPELIIGYDGDSFPIAAVCSLCGEEMSPPELPFKRSEENIEWFALQFRTHICEWRRKRAMLN